MKAGPAAVMAFKWSGLSTLYRGLLQLIQVVLLANWLTPEQFGLIALVTTINGLVYVVSDAGISSALVQNKELRSDIRSTLFWLGMALSSTLMIAVSISATAIGRYFDRPEISELLMISSLGYPLLALAASIRMIRERSLSFRAISITEMLTGTIVFGLTSLLAYSGYGALSVVVGTLSGLTITAIATWLFMRDGWLPTLSVNLSQAAPALKFGAKVSINNSCNQLAMSLDVLLGGVWLRADELGNYGFPRNLILQFQALTNPTLARVGFPLVSKFQDDKAQLKNIYISSTTLIAAFSAPFYGVLGFTAHIVFPIFFGEKWLFAADIAVPLALWGYLRGTFNPLGSLLIGTGQAGKAMQWNILQILTAGILLAVGSHGGGVSFAMASLATMAVLIFPAWYWLARPICGISGYEVAGALFRPILLVAGTFFPWWMLSRAVELNAYNAVLVTFGMFATYVLVAWISRARLLGGTIEYVRSHAR